MEWFSSPEFLFSSFVCIAIGVLAGVSGMPLGALRLPAVYLVVPTSHIAAGTNLAIDTLASMGASYRYWKVGKIEPRIFLFMSVFSCIGAFLGGYLSRFIPHDWFLLVIGIVYLYTGIKMFLGTMGTKCVLSEIEVTSPGDRFAFIAALWGFILGFVGGMVGLLMGSLRVPAMIRFMRLSPVLAAGTNMAISFCTALFGFTGHYIQKNYDVHVLVILGLASMLGAYLGSCLAINLRPLSLRRVIATSIILMATTLLLKSLTLCTQLFNDVMVSLNP